VIVMVTVRARWYRMQWRSSRLALKSNHIAMASQGASSGVTGINSDCLIGSVLGLQMDAHHLCILHYKISESQGDRKQHTGCNSGCVALGNILGRVELSLG
jgi:hypothetical protein